MTYTRIIPANTGGGRKRDMIAARLAKDGQFSMTHAVADMLGTPAKVLVDVDPDNGRILLTPTTPSDRGAFALSGGGNASYRFRAKEIVNRWPTLVGEYKPRKQARGVVFEKLED